MLKLFFLSCILIYGVNLIFAKDYQLIVNVRDASEQKLSRVMVTCEEGCPAVPSDQAGRAVLKLTQDNLSSGWVKLQIAKRLAGDPDWVLISPWDGRWPISKRSLTVIVARYGDKQMLGSGKVVEAITARVLKEVELGREG